MCFKNKKPVVYLATKGNSTLSPDTSMLISDVLFAIPGTRAAHHLIHTFLDFGKIRADHVIIGLNVSSNIKSESLEKTRFRNG